MRSRLFVVSLLLSVFAVSCERVLAVAVPVPPPKVDAALATSRGQATAVIAGGCFWGIQAVYQHVHGVVSATSGYAGGTANTAVYTVVETGMTDHAESVEIVYDPSQVTYGTLLQVFFAVAHDPTQLNRQGPDEGRQYRSAIFTSDDEQLHIASAYIAQLTEERVFGRKIVTEVVRLPRFYEAEDYHQNYATLHPDDPYIRINDAPKVDNLRRLFPRLFVER